MVGMVLQARTKATGRVVLSQDAVTACILMVVISPVLCLLNVLQFIPGLSRGNLFTGWATRVASL